MEAWVHSAQPQNRKSEIGRAKKRVNPQLFHSQNFTVNRKKKSKSTGGYDFRSRDTGHRSSFHVRRGFSYHALLPLLTYHKIFQFISCEILVVLGVPSTRVQCYKGTHHHLFTSYHRSNAVPLSAITRSFKTSCSCCFEQ